MKETSTLGNLCNHARMYEDDKLKEKILSVKIFCSERINFGRLYKTVMPLIKLNFTTNRLFFIVI